MRLDDEPDSGIDRCAVGPGRRRRSTGAVIEAYVDDGAIDRHCHTCGAQPLQFCHWPSGAERKTPCGGR